MKLEGMFIYSTVYDSFSNTIISLLFGVTQLQDLTAIDSSENAEDVPKLLHILEVAVRHGRCSSCLDLDWFYPDQDLTTFTHFEF